MSEIEQKDENPQESEKNPNKGPDGRFLPGNLANPGGRPAGTFSIRRMIADKMRQNPEEAKVFIEAIYRRALEDNDSKEFKYIEMIVESIDGKVTQPIEQTNVNVDLSEFTADDLKAFREMIKERKDAKP